MEITLYEKPLRIELRGEELLVDGKAHPRSARTVTQMKDTLMTKFPEDIEDFEVYYMYRDVYKDNDVRYDITVIPFRPLGDEYPKTHGHYHPRAEDGHTYPEVYQVHNGKALFILQRRKRDGSVDVTMVDAKKGDVVLLPPDHGHVTINSGKEVLILSNLVYDRFGSLYDDYKKNNGAAYYYVKGGSLVQNTNYFIEKNERIDTEELNYRYGFGCKDILSEFHENPSKFTFLKVPGMLIKGL